MQGFTLVVALAALPAAGNFLGGVAAEVFKVSQDAPEIITLSVLVLTGGALTSVVVEEMIQEAHEGDTSMLGRYSSRPVSPSSP